METGVARLGANYWGARPPTVGPEPAASGPRWPAAVSGHVGMKVGILLAAATASNRAGRRAGRWAWPTVGEYPDAVGRAGRLLAESGLI
jgi:hypothetical protein